MKEYKIDIWLSFGKISFAVGAILVLMSYIYSSIIGYVSGFKWMAFGSFFIFFVSILKLCFDSVERGEELKFSDIMGKCLVFSIILVPILITIYLLDNSKEKLENIKELPFSFNLSATLVYIFLVVQTFLLIQSNELDADKDKENKAKLSIILVLFFSIFVFFSLGEIYLIVNYYLTDG